MSHEITDHVVGVAVFVRAQGVDPHDAANVAEQALRQALGTTDITVHTYAGHERTASVLDVAEVGAAFRAGDLAVTPAPRGR